MKQVVVKYKKFQNFKTKNQKNQKSILKKKILFLIF